MLLPTLFCLTLAAPQTSSPQLPPPEPVHLVRVELASGGHTASDLGALGLDVVRIDPGSRGDGLFSRPTAEVVVDDGELALLGATRWNPRLLIEDLSGYYGERLRTGPRNPAPSDYGAWLSPPFASGGMGGYYTYSEIVSVLDQIQAAYPQIVASRTSLGQSHEGRDLWMVKVSDNPNTDEAEGEVRIDAAHHAREVAGMQSSLWFLLWLVEEYGIDPTATYLVDEREIFFVPCVNPDGYVYNEQTNPNGGGMWRKNRRDNGGGSWGVDLNRNYPYEWGYNDIGSSPNPDSINYRGPFAASEPETQAIVAFATARDFGTALSIHCYGNVWLSPWGYIYEYPSNWTEYQEVGDLATEVNGYTHGPASIVLYEANGTTLDFDHGTEGTMCWSPEIGSNSDGFWPAQNRIVPLAEENLLALARTSLAAGAWVRPSGLTAIDAGDGDGSYEGGEEVEITVLLRNSGRLASPAIDLTLTTTSPHAQIVVGSTTAGALAPFSDGAGAIPLVLRILPGSPAGVDIDLVVTASTGSWSEVLEDEIRVGTEVIVAAYDFEAAGDEGWSVGAPNDADTGTWTRVDPRGTEAQPEDDHTAGPGNTKCWVTGQGSVGGSVGENDVDDGSTSLWSPVFDLAGRTGARLEYWRWYSNDKGASPNEDVFRVDVSNDGGGGWTNAEEVGPAGPESNGGWYRGTIDLESVLPLTGQMRVRFVASDLGSGSIVEAAIDDVVVSYIGPGDCPAPENYCEISPNSAGSGALMSWAGSTGVSDDDFTLLAQGGPPNKAAIFLFSASETLWPLGDGFLCLGAPQYRLGVLQIDGTGQATRVIDFDAPSVAGKLTPGSTWRFQLYYRDPSFGSYGFNLSDGLRVEFCD